MRARSEGSPVELEYSMPRVGTPAERSDIINDSVFTNESDLALDHQATRR